MLIPESPSWLLLAVGLAVLVAVVIIGVLRPGRRL
jgi:hypothetical protein